MKSRIGALVLLAAMGGCASTEHVASHGTGWGRTSTEAQSSPRPLPGYVGPNGEPVFATAPSPEPAKDPRMARMPRVKAASSNGVKQASYDAGSENTTSATPQTEISHHGPKAAMPPGYPMPPGGVFVPGMAMMPPPGAVAAIGALPPASPSRFPTLRTEVRFLEPVRMRISWSVQSLDGRPAFSKDYIEAPGTYNFAQGAVYRLKLSAPNRPAVDYYPTLEVVPASSKTETFLAHSSVPVVFTDEDFDQVAAGNYVVKVIYLPDAQFQDLATTAPGEVVSTRLEAGLDPIAEAQRRGSILLVVRLGNIDLGAQHTPPMNVPSPYQMQPGMMPMMVPGSAAAPGMVMPGTMPQGMMAQGMPMPGMMPQGMPIQGMPMPGMMPQSMPTPGMMPQFGQGQPVMITPNGAAPYTPGLMPPAQPDGAAVPENRGLVPQPAVPAGPVSKSKGSTTMPRVLQANYKQQPASTGPDLGDDQ